MLETDLLVGGMTCAACVSTIENVIGTMDHVRTIAVNLLTERAHISHEDAVSARDLVLAIQDVCPLLSFSLIHSSTSLFAFLPS